MAETDIIGAEPSGAVDDDAAVRDSDDETEDTFTKLKTWFKDAKSKTQEWRKTAEEDYGFVDGTGQWDAEDKAILRDQLRPVITFNRIAPVIDTITGLESGNRQEVHYAPRQMGKVGVTELMSQTAAWVRDECDAEDEESDSFIDLCICGMGWTETRPDYEIDPEGLIMIERVDPLEMYWDPNAKKRNLADRRYNFHARRMPREDAESLFPDYDAWQLDATWASDDRDTHEPHDAFAARLYRDDQSGREGAQKKEVTLVYAEWWERETYTVIFDPFNGGRKEIKRGELKVLNQRLERIATITNIPFKPVKATDLTRKVFKSAWLGNVILKDPQTGKEINNGRVKNAWSFNAMTGKRERKTNTYYGVVRAAKDPQRWANKFFSQILHIINSNAKGGITAEMDATANVRQFEADYARPDAVTWVMPGALAKGKIQPKPAITFPTGLDKMLEFAIQGIPQTTGINYELMGQVNRDQPGVLEYQRKQAGMTILAALFQSLRRYRKNQGRALLYCIQEYITPGRLIKIDGDDGAQYIPFAKSPDLVEYDIVVDDAASSPNQKEMIWSMLSQFMPLLTQSPLSVIAEFLKYSPLPESVSTKVSQLLTQQAQQPQVDPKVQAMQAKAQLDQQQAQQKMQLEQQAAQAQAANDQRAAQLQAANDARDSANEARDNHQEFVEGMIRERMKMQAEIMAMRQRAAAEIEIERQKGDVQIEVAQKLAEAKAKAIRAQPKARASG